MAKTRGKKSGGVKSADYRHTTEKRTNIPPAAIAAEGKVPRVPKVRYGYSPHLPPQLRFDPTGKADQIPGLIAEAGRRTLTEKEQRQLTEAIENQQPWLEWSAKVEQHLGGFLQVDPVALHIHERVSTQAVLRAAAREDVQRHLFADPQQPYVEAVQFYKHDVDWANRMILGDSLHVMSSLSRREQLSGKVQMIYMDPPYGIRFGSNFQPEIGRKNVKDVDADLVREAEVVKAYRDTWQLGVHSYLSYLRDRLLVARELLTESGSIFVQIGDENVHLVRQVLDEVFGPSNFSALISFRTSVPLTSAGLASVGDYLLWYARHKPSAKYRDLYLERQSGDKSRYANVELGDGSRRSLTNDERADATRLPPGSRVFADMDLASSGFTKTCIFPFEYNGRTYRTSSGKSWKTTEVGMTRLANAGRVSDSGATIRYVLYVDDAPLQRLSASWGDTTGELDKSFVVQTHTRVIQRCMLMTTEPGDLVLDPTCGAGTTAYVAEQWGAGG
jgi:adenine-specific DNA-methyltransferase